MSAAPRISVLVPVFDGMRYLPDTMDSILSQTFSDFECLVTDDGSTDDTWQFLCQLAERDSRIRLLRNEHNRGITRSMNRMFAQARGTYVTRHDADDISLPERFATQVAFLEANPAVGAMGSLVDLIDGDGAPLHMDYFPPVLTNEAIQESLLSSNCLCQGSVLFRRTCLEQAGYYDEGFISAEDYDLWLRLAEVTQFANWPEPLYRYRFYPESDSRSRVWRTLDVNAAKAIRRALQRRYGSSPPPRRLLPPARYLLRAALVSVWLEDLAEARRQLAEALALVPALLEADEPLVELATPYLAGRPTTESLAFVEGIFRDLLPPTRRMARLKARWLSQLHMREVFAGNEQAEARTLLAHLRRGVRYDPRWLLNRGVLTIAVRAALGLGRAE